MSAAGEGLTVSATATVPPKAELPASPCSTPTDLPGGVKWFHWAEVVDAARIVPRIIIIPMFVWAAIKIGGMLSWYMWSLAPADRTGNVTAFAAAITAPICTMLGYAFKVYVTTGKDWDKTTKGSEDVGDSH
jgi:hypothetical protein